MRDLWFVVVMVRPDIMAISGAHPEGTVSSGSSTMRSANPGWRGRRHRNRPNWTLQSATLP